MPSAKLTKRIIDGLPMPSKTTIYYDQDLPGFGLRLTPAGARSWVVEYRPGGGGRGSVSKRMTLGSTATLTPDQARGAARDILARVRLGEDPATERGKRRNTPTFQDFAKRFIDEEAVAKLKPGTVSLYRIYLLKHAAKELGGSKLTAIASSDIARLHRAIGKTRQVTANRVVDAIGSMYRFASSEGAVPKDYNPARGIEAFREQGRERYLTAAELERLGAALRLAETEGLPWEIDEAKVSKHAPKNKRRTVIGPHPVAAVRLLLFTGCRLREILKLRWEEIDFDRVMLFLPDSKTGKKSVILNAPALAVLDALPRVGDFVIAGNSRDRPRADLKKPWEAIARVSDLTGVRIHDLRHSFASLGVGEGLGLPIVGKLLGHRNVHTTARYAHLDIDPLRQASERIAGRIEASMRGKDNEDVVP